MYGVFVLDVIPSTAAVTDDAKNRTRRSYDDLIDDSPDRPDQRNQQNRTRYRTRRARESLKLHHDSIIAATATANQSSVGFPPHQNPTELK